MAANRQDQHRHESLLEFPVDGDLFEYVAQLKLTVDSVDSVDQEQLTHDRRDHHLNGPLGFSLGSTRKHAHTLRWAEAKTFLEWQADFGAAATVSDASAFLEGSCAQRVVGTGDL